MKKELTTSLLLLLAATAPTVASAETLTVCEGTQTSDGAPVYGYWLDRANRSQMIYPAEKLEGLKGGTITEIKFFISSINKAWTNDDIQVSFGEVDATEFASAEYIEANMTRVASGAVSLGTDATEWTIQLATPYIYAGGNLLVNIANPSKGTAPRINWYGQNQESTTAVAKGNSIRSLNFLPQIEFTFSDEELGYRAVVNTKALTFPLTFTDGSAEKSVTVSNVGSAEVSGTLGITGSKSYSVFPEAISGLAPGESVDLDVIYSPGETSDNDEATLHIDLGEAGTFEIALNGSALSVPGAYRELFDGSDYANTIPEGWTPYAEEYFVTDNSLSDATSDYFNFPTIYRFSDYSFEDCRGIAWNHVNWAPSSELYRQYYYLVSPALSGRVMLRAMMTDLPAAGCFVEIYPVESYDEMNRRFTLSKEALAIEWENELTNGAWSVGTVNLPSDTRLAFFMKYAALDFVASDNTTGVCSPAVVPSAGGLEVYDLSGRKVNSGAFEAGSVPAGVYIIRQGAEVKKVLKK